MSVRNARRIQCCFLRLWPPHIEENNRLGDVGISGSCKYRLSVEFSLATRIRSRDWRILHDAGGDDDLVQDVFRYVFRKGGLYDRSKGLGSFKSLTPKPFSIEGQ